MLLARPATAVLSTTVTRKKASTASIMNPAAGVMLSALWVTPARRLVLIVHHLAIDAVSWWILLEDINIAWAQHRSGMPVELTAGGTSVRRWSALQSHSGSGPEQRER